VVDPTAGLKRATEALLAERRQTYSRAVAAQGKVPNTFVLTRSI
jgi:hypothetical protein